MEKLLAGLKGTSQLWSGGHAKRLAALPEIVDSSWVFGGSMVPVLTMQIGSVELRPQFDGHDFKVRVEYGPKGRGTRCETGLARALRPRKPVAADFVAAAAAEYLREPAVANVDTTCLFRGFADADAPCLRLSLRSTSGKGVAIAKSETFQVPLQVGESSRTIELFAVSSLTGGLRRTQCVGRVDVKIDWFSTRKYILSTALKTMGAVRQTEAYTASDTPVVMGSVVSTASQGKEDSSKNASLTLVGEVLNARPPKSKTPVKQGDATHGAR